MEDIEIKRHIPFCGHCSVFRQCVFWENFRYCRCWYRAARKLERKKGWRFVYDGEPI